MSGVVDAKGKCMHLGDAADGCRQGWPHSGGYAGVGGGGGGWSHWCRLEAGDGVVLLPVTNLQLVAEAALQDGGEVFVEGCDRSSCP